MAAYRWFYTTKIIQFHNIWDVDAWTYVGNLLLFIIEIAISHLPSWLRVADGLSCLVLLEHNWKQALVCEAQSAKNIYFMLCVRLGLWPTLCLWHCHTLEGGSVQSEWLVIWDFYCSVLSKQSSHRLGKCWATIFLLRRLFPNRQGWFVDISSVGDNEWSAIYLPEKELKPLFCSGGNTAKKL